MSPASGNSSARNTSSRGVGEYTRKKVAIIGSGVAGLGALWALKNTPHDVHLFEAADRLGGHTNTVEYVRGKYKTQVDTGFIVLNTATYPNFIRFLKEVKIPTEPTEMTFGVSRDHGAFEWAGTSLGAVFAQRKNLFSLRVWRMIFDIIRFNQFAMDLLREERRSEQSSTGSGIYETVPQETIGEYLEREGYSDSFRDDYLIPMTAAVWSTSPDKCSLEFPAVTLVRFMWNHHLLSTVAARPQWLTLKNGAKSYIDAIMRDFPAQNIYLNASVESVTNDDNGGVCLHLRGGKSEAYDHVIIATHGDQAHDLVLSEADAEERTILSGFQTSQNTAILHSDLSLMPRLRRAWSSWNYITKTSPTSSNIDQVCLTYNMNILQHIPESIYGHVLVTLNPLHLPDPDIVQGRYTYRHPLYNAKSIHSQSLLPRIQNTRGISYCGAWTKYGFHEDGFSSGIKIAQDHLGAKLPFDFRDSTFSRGREPKLGILDLLLRVWIVVMQLVIVVIERLFGANPNLGKGQVKDLKKRI